MHNKLKKIKANQSGFTLVELLVVIVILGLLASITLLNLGGKVEESKINKTKVDASIIESALEMYKIDNGSYPETVEALVDEYLKTEPVDPWGDSYVLTEDKSAVVIPEKAKDKDGEDEG